jgi:hypothetical protein
MSGGTRRDPYAFGRMHRRTVLLVVGLLLAAGCGRPVSPAYTTQTTLPPVPTSAFVLPPGPPPPPIVFTGDAYDLHTASPVATATFNATWAGVLDTLNKYLEAAVLTPLRTGGPAGDLTPLFNPPALERVVPGGADRFAFIDENLPPVSDLRSERAVAGLTALAGTDGTVSVVTAGLDLRLIGHIAGAPVTVVRTGELVLMPEGGRWCIDAYEIKVVRTVAEETTTTTAER